MSSNEDINLISVGMDVGSSTSHLVFSELTLSKNFRGYSKRYEVTKRKIIYWGEITDTPLIDSNTIDIVSLVDFFKQEYVKAGIIPDQIDTGAVIVTGETAKKENAKEIVELLARDTGKFVSATAGPNFEAVLAAMGSGSNQASKELNQVILNVDVGGGTSNLALSKSGSVISTACVSVGGRLIGLNHDNSISRIDRPAKLIMNKLGISYSIGEIINKNDLEMVVSEFTDILFDVILGTNNSEMTQQLVMTSNLKQEIEFDQISFSGGVAEFIYGDSLSYNDMGHILGKFIKQRLLKTKYKIFEPENKIRATVIGAGAYSLSISGSTCYLDESITFPLKNIPVLNVNIERSKLGKNHVKKEIDASFARFDMSEGDQVVALYFKDPVRPAYKRLKLFAESIEYSMTKTIEYKIPIILIFEKDIANSVGNIIKRETNIEDQLLTLDELSLEDGNWIDIGDPLMNGQVFPVTIKSLVFN